MLKKTIAKKLNGQLGEELYSSYLYLAMAAYFEEINLPGFAHWMKLQAQEELGHVMRLFDYINDRRSRVNLGPVKGPQKEWDSPLDAMEAAYKHECLVSGKINECVTLALKENDHSTNAFLQWFVAEQVEEEATSDEIVQKLTRIGDSSSGLYLLDSELSQRTVNLSAQGDPGAGA